MTARVSLSVAASAVSKALGLSFEAQTLDAGFDGGEWSGPAHDMHRPALVLRVLADLGWEVREFEREVEARTSARWVHFVAPHLTGWADLLCPSGECEADVLPHDATALHGCRLLAECMDAGSWEPQFGTGDREYDAWMASRSGVFESA